MPKYKVGDVVVWLINPSFKFKITNVSHYYYGFDVLTLDNKPTSSTITEWLIWDVDKHSKYDDEYLTRKISKEVLNEKE